MPKHLSNVLIVENDAYFNSSIKKFTNGYLVIKFFATWCKDCTIIKPFFSSLAKKQPNITFMDVNSETCQNSTEYHKVTCLPFFVIFMDGGKITSFCGINPSTLEKIVLRIIKSQNSFKKSKLIRNNVIDNKSCYGLNMSPENKIMNILYSGNKSCIKSNCGPQLLLTFVFLEKINLGSFSVSGPEDCGPKLLSVYYNIKAKPDFRRILEYKADETFELTSDELKLKSKRHLTNSKSDSVYKLIIYIQSNQNDADVTLINQIAFFSFKSPERKQWN